MSAFGLAARWNHVCVGKFAFRNGSGVRWTWAGDGAMATQFNGVS